MGNTKSPLALSDHRANELETLDSSRRCAALTKRRRATAVQDAGAPYQASAHAQPASPPFVRLFSAILSAVTLCLLGTGCKTYKDQAASMRGAWVSGQYAEAARQFTERADKKDNSKDGVIWHLEAGTALRAIGDYTNSNAQFEQAAQQIDSYEQKAKVRVSNEAGAMLSNQQNLPYEGRSYDKIMLHTYEALNYMAMEQIDKSRPEIIRAYQRQQDAVAENARRIEKAQEEAANSKDSAAVERTLNDPRLEASVEGVTGNLDRFRFYADYVNPFTVYLDGLYFLHAGEGPSDMERAHKSLSRVIEVAGQNSFVEADLAALDKLAHGAAPLMSKPLTYVIFETGRAASREQVRVDVPIIIADVSYVGIAFPKLEFHDDYVHTLTVSCGDVEENTELVASMDSIIALDFKNEWPAILTKSVISAVAKAAASYGVNTAARQQSDLGGLIARIGTAIYQAAVNIADTRSWSTLPKEFQVARVETPENRTIALSTTSGHREEVPLVDGLVNVVYVRSVTSTSPLLISQFKLK